MASTDQIEDDQSMFFSEPDTDPKQVTIEPAQDVPSETAIQAPKTPEAKTELPISAPGTPDSATADHKRLEDEAKQEEASFRAQIAALNAQLAQAKAKREQYRVSREAEEQQSARDATFKDALASKQKELLEMMASSIWTGIANHMSGIDDSQVILDSIIAGTATAQKTTTFKDILFSGIFGASESLKTVATRIQSRLGEKIVDFDVEAVSQSIACLDADMVAKMIAARRGSVSEGCQTEEVSFPLATKTKVKTEPKTAPAKRSRAPAKSKAKVKEEVSPGPQKSKSKTPATVVNIDVSDDEEDGDDSKVEEEVVIKPPAKPAAKASDSPVENKVHQKKRARDDESSDPSEPPAKAVKSEKSGPGTSEKGVKLENKIINFITYLNRLKSQENLTERDFECVECGEAPKKDAQISACFHLYHSACIKKARKETPKTGDGKTVPIACAGTGCTQIIRTMTNIPVADIEKCKEETLEREVQKPDNLDIDGETDIDSLH